MAGIKPGVLALFDVDGTLTAPRKVANFIFLVQIYGWRVNYGGTHPFVALVDCDSYSLKHRGLDRLGSSIICCSFIFKNSFSMLHGSCCVRWFVKIGV